MAIKLSQILYLCLLVCFTLANQSEVPDGSGVVKKKPTPFTHWSWVWAFGCLLTVVLVRQWIRNEGAKKLDIDVLGELRKRDNAYRVEEYEADVKNGALQTLPKDADDCISLKLSKKTKVNHDTYYFRYNNFFYVFRFEFPKNEMELGLPLGGHVFFYATVHNPEIGKEEEISRKYTPTSDLHQKGYCEFLIKVYHAGVHPKFPHGGLMTQHLEKMNIGETMKMEGPKGKLKYTGRGNFTINKKYFAKKKIGMVAGGSGITPMFQIIQAVIKNKDKVDISLLFANKSEKDILIREELEQFQQDYPNNFKVNYIIDKADNPNTWKHETGYVTKKILQKYMPPVSEDSIILTCGPLVMNNLVEEYMDKHRVHMF